MCGIAGALLESPRGTLAVVHSMCDQMIPRGPDDGGCEPFWLGDRPVALGSRRLAIIDPSPAGHQPMLDVERGNALVFNGMIYNFRELRAKLERAGERFVSHCDTEVVLRAYGVWGDEFVERLKGMFALALLDSRHRRLVLARDRLGIKPIYYWHRGGELVFASQIRALLQAGVAPRRLSPAGVAAFLAYGAVQEPYTAIEGVSALPAAHVGIFEDDELILRSYWRPPTHTDTSTPAQDVERGLLDLLSNSVDRHLVSDRPAGVFLSGGVDSSVIAALAASNHPGVKTISVVFEDRALSEAKFARSVAQAIGSEHTEVLLTRDDLRRSLDGAFAAMDQPTFDGINTYIVSRAAAESGLKVALSGLGADELFDGYGFVRKVEMLEHAARLPRMIAIGGARAATVLRGSRGAKARAWLGGDDGRSAYELLRSLFSPVEIERLLLASTANGNVTAHTYEADDSYNRLSVAELCGYLRNVLLRDTDAMSMANSIEVRVPYLYDPLVEWTLQLPGAIKGRSKELLRRTASGLVPREAWDRPKQGFLLPIAAWLRTELGVDVANVLATPPAAVRALVDPRAMLAEWARFSAGTTSWLRPWSLYALSRWAEEVGAS